MIRSLFAGIAGMKVHQIGIEVVGNDLANINTVGYKSHRARFEDLLAQTIKGATSGTGEIGGSNPIQVGLGSKLSAVDVNFTQGSLQTTGRSLDMAIEGDGFFKLVGPNGDTYYTRVGAFDTDESGFLIDPSTGYKVQGFQWDTTTEQFTTPSEEITIDFDANAGQATSTCSFAGNLSSTEDDGTTIVSSINVYDENSAMNTVTITLTKDETSDKFTWDYAITSTGNTVTNGTGTLHFNTNGSLDTGGSTVNTFTLTPASGVSALSITPNFGTDDAYDGAISFAEDTTFTATDQNGYTAGSVEDISVDSDGVLSAKYTNGEVRYLYKIALVKFNNPSGLLNAGSSYFIESPNSGTPVELSANQGGIGKINPSSLERSNVDLSEAFVEMILQQRGFQANARIISTTDQFLQESVNLRR